MCIQHRYSLSVGFLEKTQNSFKNQPPQGEIPENTIHLARYIFIEFTFSLRITGPCCRELWMCIAGFLDLQTTSFEVPWFLGLLLCSWFWDPILDPIAWNSWFVSPGQTGGHKLWGWRWRKRLGFGDKMKRVCRMKGCFVIGTRCLDVPGS